MKPDDLNQQMADEVEAELLAQERLLWIGQPVPGRMLLRSSRSSAAALLGALIALALTGGLFFVLTATRAGAVSRSPMMGGIFALIMLVGLVAVLGPMIMNALTARRTVYTVTDRRALVIAGLLSRSVQSYGPDDIEFIKRTMRGGDVGDLVFRYETRRGAASFGGTVVGMQSDSVPVGFFAIRHAREVEALMLETFKPDAYREKPKRREVERADEMLDADESEGRLRL